MSERLYTVSQAGEMLGGIHPRDVHRLISDRKLNAKVMVRRGKIRPRKFITAAELDRFISSLANYGETTPSEKEKRTKHRDDIATELEKATNYAK